MKKKLKEICTIEKGKQIDTKALNDSNSYRYINGGIKESGFYNDFNTSGETVLISEGGASCGYVNYVNEQFWCGCHCYRLTDINAFPKFLFYSLKASQNEIMELRTGAAMPNIKKESLKNFEISIIEDKEEQIKIAAELDTIQSAIDNKKQQLSLLDEAVKSEFVEMFGEIDISPQRNDWTELKDITTIYTGTTPSTTDEENWNGDILWITPAEMTSESFYIYDTERKITEKGQKSKNLSLMPANTVLLSTRAPIGKVGIAGSPMTCNQGFKNFYCKEDVLNPVYLYFLFKLNTEYLNSKGTGTTFKELSKSAAEKIKVPIPPLDLQNQFAAFVQQIDKSKFVVKQQITDLQELLDSKMQEYFS